MSINRVTITGNLTRDPELRQSQAGTSILRFGVAVNDRRRNQQTGEWEDYPNFIDCVMFGNRAESLNRILTKGMKVAIEGKLHYSTWEREGQRHSKIEVYVDEVEFMTSRQGGGQGGQQYGGGQMGQQYGGGQGGYGQDRPAYNAPAPVQQPQPQPTYASPAPAQAPQQYQQPQPQNPGAQTPPSPDVYDEDIPF